MARVQQGDRFEVSFRVPDLLVPPDSLHIDAAFSAPSGKTIHVGGFASGGDRRFKVRFAPREVGAYHYEVVIDAGHGQARAAAGDLDVSAGTHAGFARVDPKNPHALILDDGSAFEPLGENRVDLFEPSALPGGLNLPDYVAFLARSGMNTVRVFIYSDCIDDATKDHRQATCIEPEVGRFDDEVASRFDALFDAAEKNGVYVILDAFGIGFTPGADRAKSWNDNPYNTLRGGPAASPEDFFRSRPARAAAKRRLLYLLARYGSSPNLLAIDLLNEPERDGAVPASAWIPWARDLAGTWHRADPYGHLVTAGPVGLDVKGGADEKPWYADAGDNVVQWHLEGDGTADVHALAAETTRRVLEAWPFGHPVLCGGFALTGEDTATWDQTHVGLWSLAMSGAGALARSALPSQKNPDETMPAERAAHFHALSHFLAHVDRTEPLLPHPPSGSLEHDPGVWSLGRADYRVLWVLAPKESYGAPRSDDHVHLKGLPDGRYRVEWWDDVRGEQITSGEISAESGAADLPVPKYVRHIAAIVEPLS